MWLLLTILPVVILGAILIYQGVQNRAQQELPADGARADKAAKANIPEANIPEANTPEDGDSSEAEENQYADTDLSNRRKTIKYDGKEYQYNSYLSNFLFLGIDKAEIVKTTVGKADAGQADALFLLSWDRMNHNLNLIAIPRDTMTDIEVFSVEGKSLGKTRDHLSISYAFGDGRFKSCELTREAVSNLFYGLTIEGYCALNQGGIAAMLDLTGGVEVTLTDDSLQGRNEAWTAGSTVLLDNENIELYLRYRDTGESHSAINRLGRQSLFLSAFADKAMAEFNQDKHFITDLYEELSAYMVTNMGNGHFVKIMQDAVSYNKLTSRTIPGEAVEGEDYDEYQVDEDALYQLILELFYVQVDSGE